MQNNRDLMDIQEVCQYYGLSEPTIRRRLKEHREGIGTFPLPLFKSGCKLLWRRIDIEAWTGEETEVVEFMPAFIPAKSPIAKTREAAQIAKRLEAHNINLPLQAVGEANG